MTAEQYKTDALPVPEQGTASYRNIHLLFKKLPHGEEIHNIFPVTYTQSVYDGKTGANLEHILHLFNHIFLQFLGTPLATRNLLPKDMRRKGIMISYRDIDNNVITETNIDESESTSDNWGLDKYWAAYGINLDLIVKIIEDYIDLFFDDTLLEQVKEYIDQYFNDTAFEEIKNYIDEYLNGTWLDTIKEYLESLITEAVKLNPDDLDKNDDNQIQLADRDLTSGMGYVILRKNKTFAEQVTKENTIYEIRYDYDLNGGEVTIPANCILKFNGGSLSNGHIKFDDTSIISENKIFEDIEYSGRVINSINVKWFGAVGDGTTDDTEAFIKALRSYQDYDYVYLTKNAGNTIYVPRGSYRIYQTLYLRKGCVLKGDGSGNTFIDYYKATGYAINMGNTPPEEGDDDHPNGTNDPGGLQPIVQDLFLTSTLGGNGIFVNVAGFKILDCWFTCGTSITASGVDGIISRCVNDNGAVFLKLNTINLGVTDYDKTHTVAVSDCITYACTYCALWLNGLYGVTISNCSFYYSRNHTVLIESDTGNVQFSNCDFRMSLAEGYYNEDSCNFYSVNGGLYDSTIVGCTFSCAQQYDILFSKWKDTLISDCIFKDSNNTSLYITNSSGIHVHGCTFIRIKNSPIWVYSPAYLDENIFKDCNADSKSNEWDNACIRVNGENSSNSIIRNNICNNENYVSSFTTATINNIVHGNRSLGKSRDSYVYTTSGGIFENERTLSFSNEAKCHLGGTQYTPTLTSTDGGFNYHNTEKHISFIWDSKSWRNPDFTNPNKVAIHNYVYDDIESIQNDFNNIGNNSIHKIVSDIDLKGGTLQINIGCTLIFDGGSISNGTLQLTGTKILPMGIDITKYVTASISGTYAEGQVLYDSSLKKMKLYNGTEWVNLDGTALAEETA